MTENNKQLNNAHLQLLNKFLVDNIELEELSAKLSVFNVFSVLKIEQAEIRHSNVLAWLLDPQGSHGLGQFFLRRVLSTILLDNESDKIRLTPAQVELMNLLDVEIFRERKNIDLIAVSQSNEWILLVENKIKARPTKLQLSKYLDIIKKDFTNFTIIPVLLTLLEIDDESDIFEETDYICWSHSKLYEVVDHVTRQRQDRIPQDAKVFLEHYLNILRRLTMQDEEIVKLCKAIYRKHKDAIDLIVDYGATSHFGAAAEDFVRENKNIMQLNLAPRRMWFIPKKWGKIMPPCSDRWKFLSKPYPISCRFNFHEKASKIGFIIEVGSMEDSDKRLKLIKTFQDNGFKMSKKAFRKESKFTRIHTIYRKLTDPDDQEEMRKHFDELWEKSQKAMETTTNIIESFKW